MNNKLIIPLRVKNANLFIDDWLKCYENLVDGIVVVDNGSDDGTYEKLKAHPKVIDIVCTKGFHEGRDFQLLLDMLKKYTPEWILVVDADEIFEDRVTADDLQRMMDKHKVSHYRFRRFHLFKDWNHYMATPEILRSYCAFGDRSMFRFSENLHVPDKHVHTSIMGRPRKFRQSEFRILHLPFLHKEYRLKLYDNYLNVDKNPKNIRTYKRDIQMLENPDSIKVLPFRKGFLAVWIEYQLYNLLSLVTAVEKRLKTTLKK